jgi:hypothetical protein
MAQYAVLLYAPELTSEPTGADLGPYDRHAEELRQSGTLVAAFALQRTATATSLRGDMVTDGPFIETKEAVAGFYVIEAPDLGAALDIARRNPLLRHGGGLEVRPVAV